MPDLPVACIFGVKNVSLNSGDCPAFETNEIDCRCYFQDDDLLEILANDRPSIIVSFGDVSDFPNLCDAPLSVRKKWHHYESTEDLHTIGREVFSGYIANIAEDRSKDEPLISVFTSAYNTGDLLIRPYESLISQDYPNWEWVVWDDSEDGGETFDILCEMAESDPRIRPFKGAFNSGSIGEVKRNACGLCRGEYLVELDHDDELTSDALGLVVRGFQSNPDVGFIYTDCTECFEDGSQVRYPDGWGYGYGSYRDECHNGQDYAVLQAPNINPKTIRHIVAAPNHLRSWRTSVYHEIGGHNPSIHVADDYEIMVRTFLKTRLGYIKKMCYIQYRNASGNTHRSRNKDIQRLVRSISIAYDDAIHDRFEELGVNDFVWSEKGNSFDNLLSVPNEEPEQHCTVYIEI